MLLDDAFQFTADALLAATDEHTNSSSSARPTTPRGNDLLRTEIEKTLAAFSGLVIIDEAYNDFSSALLSCNSSINTPIWWCFKPSRRHGVAQPSVWGMAFASAEIISIFNKIKYPYNVNQLTQQQALSMLQRYDEIEGWVKELIAERGRLMDAFTLTCVKEIFPSDANFFLARVTDAGAIYITWWQRAFAAQPQFHFSLRATACALRWARRPKTKLCWRLCEFYGN